MTPHDITIFQCLAGLFTLSFIALTFLVLRFLQGLEESRKSLMGLAIRLEKGLEPILEDLRSGAAHLRSACERTRHGAEQLGELGDQIESLASLTKTGAKGILAMLVQAFGAFLKKRMAVNEE